MRLSRLVPIAVIVSALALSSCANTVRGIGKDVRATADAVADSVE
ncbi:MULTISPECIES: entericidin EcnAB [unclassified Mesorhizobium]|nr:MULTISPECIES: entericidin EcnAB [unclassified Mesorhizobium]